LGIEAGGNDCFAGVGDIIIAEAWDGAIFDGEICGNVRDNFGRTSGAGSALAVA